MENPVQITAERDPSNIDWSGMNTDIVAECTGIFTSQLKLPTTHLEAQVLKKL